MLIFKEEDVSFFQRKKYGVLFYMPDLHIHEHHELYYLENGETSYFCGNSIYHLKTGDFILIPKGTFHRTDNSAYPNLERVLFNFDDEFLGVEYYRFFEELARSPHIVLPESKLPSIRRLIEKTESEDLAGNDENIMLKQLYFRELLILLSRYRKKDTQIEYSGAQKIAQDAAVYISENYRQELSLSSLAKKYSVSVGYFSKLFKKHTGMGVNEYISITRTVAAKELFDTTDMTVTEVAFECGFNDSNYFSQIFKRSTGLSPKKYSMLSKNS